MFTIVGSKTAIPPLVEVIVELIPVIIKGDGGSNDFRDCNCNLIITNSSAQNRPNDGSTTDGSVCTMVSPHEKGKNWDPHNDDDELVWTSQIGASKGFLFFINTDGGDDIGSQSNPDRFSLPASSFSRIRYKIVCANPLSQKPDNSCVCNKSIDLEWEYASNYHWSLDDGWHVFGSDNSIYLEDWALAVLSLPNNSEILDRGLVNKRGACDSQPLTSTFTQLTEVALNVESAINDPTITSIITGSTGVLDFFGAVSSLAECNSKRDSTVTLLQGKRDDIILKPGEQLIFSIISGSILGGHVRNNGRGTARIVSEGYVSGVLFSNAGGSEGCCDNEKIGSYALGSLSEFPFSKTTFIHKKNKSTLESDLDEGIFNEAGPMGGYNSVAATVSSFIGINGPWGGVFDPSGCCDDVIIDCYSKCGIYRKCGEVERSITIIDADSKIKYSTNDVSQLKISEEINAPLGITKLERQAFPNPNNGEVINIKLNKDDSFNKIMIFDASGKSYVINNWVQEMNIVEIRPEINLSSGMIIIMLIDESNNIAYHSKIIKI